MSLIIGIIIISLLLTGSTSQPPLLSTPAASTFPKQTIIFTFPTPGSFTTKTIVPVCSDCGLCGFCTERNVPKCYCYEGCEYDHNSNTCRDINECQLLPCIYGSCINVVGTYYCKCERGYAGRDCGLLKDPNITGPIAEGMNRAKGIIAGGGEVEILGRYFDLFPPINVTFSCLSYVVLHGGISRNVLTSSKKFFVVIPRTNATNLSINFTLTVGFTTEEVIDIPGSFVYTDNPSIYNITPVNPLVTYNGGALLTMSGTNLNVPTKTFVLIQIEIFNYSVNIFKASGNSSCVSLNLCSLTCPMPNFKIPNDSHLLNSTDNLNKTLTVTTLTDAYELPTNDMTPSFKVPRITTSGELEYYDPEYHGSLKIPAVDVDTVSTSTKDYSVEIGDDNCAMTILISNLLECMPPASPPRVLQSSITACKSDGAAVYVNAFGTHQFAKCVKYYNSKRPIIIGLGIASILVVVILIVIGFLMCRMLRFSLTNGHEIQAVRREVSAEIFNGGISSIYGDNVELGSIGEATTDTGTRIKFRDTVSVDNDDDVSNYMQPNWNR